jgi:hypothetical protein
MKRESTVISETLDEEIEKTRSKIKTGEEGSKTRE